MFSVRTTFGSISIIIADAFICSLIFWFTLSHVFWAPHWHNSGGLLNHASLDLITLIVVLSLAITHLYSYMEYYYPTDLFKQIITSFLISLGSIAILGYLTKGITSLDLGFVAPLAVTYVFLFVFRYLLYFAVRDNRTRVLILGANDLARSIVEEGKNLGVTR
jgi:FlaA1/EpsC-like NDP-sugar epimerase